MDYRPGSIKFQSRPATVDMTSRSWGDLTALSKGALHYWRFRCSAGHESLLHGGSVRRAAREHEAGTGTPYMRCPECKASERK